MFRNYLKVAVRSLARYRGLTSINIFGLAAGMACTIFILMWVQDELSYDRFHENAEVIYRVEQDQVYSGEIFHVSVTPYPPGPVFKTDIPEVVEAVRLDYIGTRLVRHEDRVFYEGSIGAVDPSMFSMFTYPFVEGDPTTALTDPNSIVLTQEMATKYFGEEPALGKLLTLGNEYSMTVTGVMEDVPNNSTVQFDMLVPFEFLHTLDAYSESWGSNSIRTFIQVLPGTELPILNDKLTAVMAANRNQEAMTTTFMGMPLTDIHLKAYFGFGHPTGDIKYIYVFVAIALFVLLIACINFMNLSTARSARRAKEIGLRKTSGAGRGEIAGQFLFETVFLALIALSIALVIVALLLGPLNTLTGKEMTVTTLLSGKFILGALGIALATGLLAGSYPALYLSSFRPAAILKGGVTSGTGNVTFRRTLVVLQFGLSIFLIIGTGVAQRQLEFMKDGDLGYDRDHVITIRMRDDVRESYQTLKSTWLQNPEVRGVTASQRPPSSIGSNSGGADWRGKDPELDVLISHSYIEPGFTSFMGMEMAEGRGFSPDRPADVRTDSIGAWVINEATAELMNMESVVGEEFSFMGVTGPIIGVVKNYHFNSLRTEIQPLALLSSPPRLQYMSLRLDPADISGTIAAIESTWNSVVPDYPLEYRFLDEDFDRMYRGEERMSDLLGYFSLIAVLIACLGLVGLAAYSAEQRRKEIGIRKVIGATEFGVSFLLCKEFLMLVIVANLLAWPAAYFASTSWLESFAYRTELGISIFLVTGVSALLLALVTVSYQAVRAAFANPVDALQYE